MLNWNTVLKYIKGRLALPSSFIEKNDEQIKEWIEMTAIPDFSSYFPDVEFTSVLSTNVNYRVPGKTNVYRFFDDEELDIYSIKECYFSQGDDFITGHPPVGAFSFEGLKCWSLQVFKSRFFKPFSQWNKTYKFMMPNQVMVLPDAGGDNFVVEYEREQPHDLRKIPPTMKRLFMDLALSEVKIQIGEIRSQYGDGRLSTPFGEIPLNGDTLKQEGNDLKRETMEKLADETIPPVIIDIE